MDDPKTSKTAFDIAKEEFGKRCREIEEKHPKTVFIDEQIFAIHLSPGDV